MISMKVMQHYSMQTLLSKRKLIALVQRISLYLKDVDIVQMVVVAWPRYRIMCLLIMQELSPSDLLYF